MRTVWQQRQVAETVAPLSAPLAVLMKRTLGKRVRQLSQLASVWDEVIPRHIREHTALESYSRGTLTVVVDSAPHRFELQTLLNAGLKSQLQERLACPLDKVRLVPGQFYSVDVEGMPRYAF
jgi:hypothetical protein